MCVAGMELIISLIKQWQYILLSTESFNSKDKHQNKMVNNFFAMNEIQQNNKS